MKAGREAVIRELQTLMPEGSDGYQVCKSVLKLSEREPGTFAKIGPQRAGRKRPMSQAEAGRLVARARARIASVDAGES